MTHLVPVLRPVLGTPFRRGSLYRAAGEVPSFHIAPARTGTAADLITGSVLGTYNSASPAWAVGPDGVLFQPTANAPVIEYDPTTLACLGARIWGAVTNLCLRSEELTDAIWLASTSSMSANTVIAPTGQLTADTLTGTGNIDFIYQIITVSPNTTYTASVFVRLGTMPAADYRVAVYNQTAGSFIAVDVAVAQTPTSSGWTRISYQFTTPSGCTSIRWYPFRNITVTGQTVHLFGPQVNTGPLAPYVPTTTTAASSTADVWSITGADFSRIWNQSAATMYAEATRDVVPAGDFPSVCGAYGTAFSDRIAIRYLTETIASFEVFAANIDQFICFPSVTTRTRRFAAASETDNFAASFNGAAPLIDTSGTNPTVSRIFIGSNPNAQFLNGYIRELAIFRSRRPNANLQALTQ